MGVIAELRCQNHMLLFLYYFSSSVGAMGEQRGSTRQHFCYYFIYFSWQVVAVVVVVVVVVVIATCFYCAY